MLAKLIQGLCPGITSAKTNTVSEKIQKEEATLLKKVESKVSFFDTIGVNTTADAELLAVKKLRLLGFSEREAEVEIARIKQRIITLSNEK
jgi:hypothetical protein